MRRNKKSKSPYGVGQNPNSLANLRHDGRPTATEVYGEPKKKRTLSVTESGWQASAQKIKKMGYSSVSEFLEEFGREEQPA